MQQIEDWLIQLGMQEYIQRFALDLKREAPGSDGPASKRVNRSRAERRSDPERVYDKLKKHFSEKEFIEAACSVRRPKCLRLKEASGHATEVPHSPGGNQAANVASLIQRDT
jgi:16S rRNA C967 or C1407 C5-methylase (RsmB/RsmF family)